MFGDEGRGRGHYIDFNSHISIECFLVCKRTVLTTNSLEDNCDDVGEIRSMLSSNSAKSDTLRVAIARMCYILVKDVLKKRTGQMPKTMQRKTIQTDRVECRYVNFRKERCPAFKPAPL